MQYIHVPLDGSVTPHSAGDKDIQQDNLVRDRFLTGGSMFSRSDNAKFSRTVNLSLKGLLKKVESIDIELHRRGGDSWE